MGKVVINVGPMFSGKTTALQQQGLKHIKANQNVLFLKPVMDNRYSENYIVSHDGVSVEAENIDDSILEKGLSADIIFIDEVQFLPETIVPEMWELIKKGKTVYCSGLDTDFKGNGFPTTMKIMAIADTVNKFTSICAICKGEATMSSKKGNGENLIELGSEDLYYPTCKECYINERIGE